MRSSGRRPRICTVPSGERVAVNCARPCGPSASGRGTSVDLSEKTSGSRAVSSPTTRSKSACATVGAAISVTSTSEMVTDPAPSSFMAAITASAASAQRGDGAPSPCVQAGVPGTPALRAAARMRPRARSLSAAQASKRGPCSSITKRSVKGAMTGRGAEMRISTGTPCGRARPRSSSNRRFWAGLSAMAVTCTPSAATEILDRGSSRSAARPKSTA